MSKKEIEVHVDKDNKIDFKEFIEMKIKYDDEYFKKDKEIQRLKGLCDKYEEEHKTTFEEWKKTINIIKEVREYIENVETLATIDKVNIFSISTLKSILDKGKE